jgi:hypothetical protein
VLKVLKDYLAVLKDSKASKDPKVIKEIPKDRKDSLVL